MKKQHRTLIVMFVAVMTAALGSYGVYRAVLQMPVREVEVASVQVVVAAQPLSMGTRLDANHLRVVDWPSRNPVVGAFSDPKQLVNRGLISSICCYTCRCYGYCNLFFCSVLLPERDFIIRSVLHYSCSSCRS